MSSESLELAIPTFMSVKMHNIIVVVIILMLVNPDRLLELELATKSYTAELVLYTVKLIFYKALPVVNTVDL